MTTKSAENAGFVGFWQDRHAWFAAAIGGILLALVAAPGPSWLDSAEFIAAAAELGGIHPPGHPAWLSIAGLAHGMPLGPYSARVVWLSVLFGAGCVLLTARLGRRVMGAFGHTAAGGWWAFGAGLLVAASGSLWFAGARAEVYTLQCLTCLWALDAALRAGDAARDGRPYGHVTGACVEVAVAVAVGLLNHHYITLFTLPALVVAGWPALALLARNRPRGLMIAAGCAAFLGLGYAAPSLRALADTELAWGNPATGAGFWDGVFARHFQASVTDADVSIADNLAVLFGALGERTGVWLAALGLIGLGLGALRRTRGWLAAALLFVGGLATKAPMAINTHNPDDYGYTLVSVAMLGVGIAAFGGFMFGPDGPLQRLTPTRRRRLSVLILPWLILMSGLNAAQLWADPDVRLSHMRAPDVIDSHMRARISPGALYLSNYVFLAFNEQAFRIAEGRRPDIAAAHLSFRTGDTDRGHRFALWFKGRHADLGNIAIAAARQGGAPIGNILGLVERFDVFAEPDPDNRIPTSLYGFDGFADRLVRREERTMDYDVRPIAERHERIWDDVYARIDDVCQLDRQTIEVLSYQHALEAAHALRRGWRMVADKELVRARALAPRDGTIAGLQRRVAQLDSALQQGDAKMFRQLWLGFSKMPLGELAGPRRTSSERQGGGGG